MGLNLISYDTDTTNYNQEETASNSRYYKLLQKYEYMQEGIENRFPSLKVVFLSAH